jgi:hypothetical protein
MKALWITALLCPSLFARLHDELPAYPNTAQVQIGDELIIGGEYFRISYFTTPDSMSAVADYFFQTWKGMGLPTMVDGDPRDGLVVSAFYTREGLQRSIVLKERAGKTIGFATVRDLWFRAYPSLQEGMFSPADGIVWLQTVESRDGAARLHHRTALIESRFGSIGADIKQQLAGAGYVLKRETALARQGARHLTLEHIKGERRIVTNLAEVEAGATAIVQTCLGCIDESVRLEQDRSAAGKEAH